jgi:hypothetical protein
MRGKKHVIRWSAVLVVVAHLGAVGALALPADVNLDVDPLYQGDYPDKLDNSDKTIASDGCTLTAYAMEINFYLKKAGIMKMAADGSKMLLQYTPADLNKLLNDYRYVQKEYKKGADGKPEKGPDGKYIVVGTTTRNGWGVEIGDDGKPKGSSTEINVGALRKAIEADTKAKDCEGKGIKMEKMVTPGFSGATPLPEACTTLNENFLAVLALLESGNPVPVRVANDTHTVLVTSFHQTAGKPRGVGRYDIKDPFRAGDGSSIMWLDDNAYKNMIYDYGSSIYKPGSLAQTQNFAIPSETFFPLDAIFDPEENPEALGPQVFWDNTARVVAAADVPEPVAVGLLAMLGVGLGAARRGSARRAVATMSPA